MGCRVIGAWLSRAVRPLSCRSDGGPHTGMCGPPTAMRGGATAIVGAMPADAVAILGAGRQALETAGYCAALGIETALFVEERPPAYVRSPEQYSGPIHRLG